MGARVHIPGGRRAENNKVRLSSGTPLPPLHLPPSSIPLPPLSPAPLTLPSLEPSTLVYERPVPRSPFNLDPTYALQARRPYIHTYIHTYRRTYGGTSYLFYFIVSRSHPQAWVNIFLRDRAPTHPSLFATFLSTVTTPYPLIVAVFRSKSSFPQHRHPSSPPFFWPYPGSVDIANQRADM